MIAPDTVPYLPAGHSEQTLRPVDAAYVPAWHVVHTALEDAPHACEIYCPVVQLEQPEHCAFDDKPHAVEIYCPVVQLEQLEHCVLDDEPQAVEIYCPVGQLEHVVHTVLDDAVHAAEMYFPAVQLEQLVHIDIPDALLYFPAGQAVHADSPAEAEMVPFGQGC